MAELLISHGNLRSRRHGAAALAVLAMTLAGCGNSRGGSIPYDVQLAAPDAPQAAALEANYRIATLDTLRVNVFNVPDLSGEFQVDLIGNISMPLIGNVSAIGLTTDELEERLAQRLGERYLNNPDVTVGVQSSTSRVVTVDGSVRQPGAHPIPGQSTLLQAVAMAGGPDQDANPRRVYIFRTIDGQRMHAAFDLTSIRRGEAEDPVVYRGDIIIVDGSRFRAIQRDILTTLPIFTLFRPF